MGEICAAFQAFVFEPDLNSLGAKNETGRAERPTRWEARSQDVEVKFVAHQNALAVRTFCQLLNGSAAIIVAPDRVRM